MNGRKILGLIAIVGLARMAFGGHHHSMGPRGRSNWQDRAAEFHRELHRRDAEAGVDTVAATPITGA